MKMEKKFESESGLDRISELPEPIKVHILSSLEIRDAVRSSILSTSWRALAILLPNLDFSSCYFLMSPMNDYLSVCDRDAEASRVKRDSIIKMREGIYTFLDRVSASSLELDQFKLCVPDFGSNLISRLDQWVDGAVGRRVKELELEIRATQRLRYNLPKSVLTSNSIMKLKLQNCELNLTASMDTMLPLLRELCLECVMLNEMIMGSLLDSCVHLENLTIKDCQGLSKLAIVGLRKLAKVNVEQYRNDMEVIKIVAPHLLEFSYKYDGASRDDTCLIELDGCQNMKHLELDGSHLNDSDLDAFLGKLPLLESLFLQNCGSLAYVKIYNQHLFNLFIDNCRELVKVRVDTPNLKLFYYAGEDPISFLPKGSALKLTKAAISLKPDFRGSRWFNGLIKLLAKLSHSEDLELEVATDKDIIIPETVRTKFRPPLYAVKHLSIEFRLPMLKSLVEVTESVLWLAPCPESMSISNYHMSSHKLFKFSFAFQFSYKRPLKGKKKCGCWKSLPINCWRHSLKTVTIQNRGRDDTELVNFFEKEKFDGKIECFNAEPNSEDDSCSFISGAPLMSMRTPHFKVPSCIF